MLWTDLLDGLSGDEFAAPIFEHVEALIGNGKYADASMLLTRAMQHVALHPGEISPKVASRFYFARGCVYDWMDKQEQAIADFETSIKLDRMLMPVHLYLAIVLERSGKMDAALEAYNSAISIDPHSDALNLRAIHYHRRKMYNQAISDSTRVLMMDVTNTFAWIIRGDTHKFMGQQEEALDDYSKACDLDASNSRRWIGRGFKFQDDQEFYEMVQQFASCIQLRTRNKRVKGIQFESHQREEQNNKESYDSGPEHTNYEVPAEVQDSVLNAESSQTLITDCLYQPSWNSQSIVDNHAHSGIDLNAIEIKAPQESLTHPSILLEQVHPNSTISTITHENSTTTTTTPIPSLPTIVHPVSVIVTKHERHDSPRVNYSSSARAGVQTLRHVQSEQITRITPSRSITSNISVSRPHVMSARSEPAANSLNTFRSHNQGIIAKNTSISELPRIKLNWQANRSYRRPWAEPSSNSARSDISISKVDDFSHRFGQKKEYGNLDSSRSDSKLKLPKLILPSTRREIDRKIFHPPTHQTRSLASNHASKSSRKRQHDSKINIQTRISRFPKALSSAPKPQHDLRSVVSFNRVSRTERLAKIGSESQSENQALSSPRYPNGSVSTSNHADENSQRHPRIAVGTKEQRQFGTPRSSASTRNSHSSNAWDSSKASHSRQINSSRSQLSRQRPYHPALPSQLQSSDKALWKASHSKPGATITTRNSIITDSLQSLSDAKSTEIIAIEAACAQEGIEPSQSQTSSDDFVAKIPQHTSHNAVFSQANQSLEVSESEAILQTNNTPEATINRSYSPSAPGPSTKASKTHHLSDLQSPLPPSHNLVHQHRHPQNKNHRSPPRLIHASSPKGANIEPLATREIISDSPVIALHVKHQQTQNLNSAASASQSPVHSDAKQTVQSKPTVSIQSINFVRPTPPTAPKKPSRPVFFIPS
eukprot:TRINITY_DN10020_c0_g1_i1.p1 TRINITY_DN10020_c0_g1~~TRINITY_DN10020_c0_g1_i1.p1  ORF type:complete len:938 (-),score=127.01 TRINITY_DN10020_c0_g1_i1:71-2884(-)